MSEGQNGKGDSPRNCFSEQFRTNYDAIFGKPREAERVRTRTGKQCWECLRYHDKARCPYCAEIERRRNH